MLQIIIIKIKRWVQPELDRTTALLREARQMLDRTLQENTLLRNRNDHLNVQVNRLEADNRDLHTQIARMREANDLQQIVIARMEQSQAEFERALKKAVGTIETLKDRVLKLEAERGNLPHFPDDTK